MTPFAPSLTGTRGRIFDNTGTLQATISGSGDVLRIVNTGSVLAFVAVSPSSTIAAVVTTSMPVLPLSVEFINVPGEGTLYAAGITNSGTAPVNFTRGQSVV